MDTHTALEKLKAAAPASFHVLDAAKSKRLKAATMYIPSPDEVAQAIRAIPKGSTKTVAQLRTEMAALAHADTTCPGATIKYWKWLALLSEPMAGAHPSLPVPWWRLLKDGQPSRHMPGGVAGQRAKLAAEGVFL